MTDRAVGTGIGLLSAAVVGVTAWILLAPQGGRAAYDARALPAVNAALNATSAVLLTIGFVCIRLRRVAAHRACMVSAFVVSTLFLVSYLVYHAQAGSVPFAGRGAIRAVYFALLVSHIVLAVAIVPLALTTLYRAATRQIDRHRRIARWTLPLWLYVSVSGVVVYWMLYHLPVGP
jgi:uncharacterized membrane protein YozB (DUF420 family)